MRPASVCPHQESPPGGQKAAGARDKYRVGQGPATFEEKRANQLGLGYPTRQSVATLGSFNQN